MKLKELTSLFFAGAGFICQSNAQEHPQQPNVVFVFADEWRGQDVGYVGNKDVETPNLDKLAKRAVNFTNTIATCPVSAPYRGILLTGQHSLTNGVFLNDVQLNPESRSLGKVFKENGYQTAYIGKWHLDGHGRRSFIPVERRQGFDYWKVLECTHNYNDSYYWGNDDKLHKWEGYDAFAQTIDAAQYLKAQEKSQDPFLLVLSYGPPHAPFDTAPESFKQKYRDKKLKIRNNVPSDLRGKSAEELMGYYAHISAIDSCIGVLQKTLEETGLDKNTIFVFTSDHGAMVQSHGYSHKQRPYEESIHVPMLIRYPAVFGNKGKKSDILIGTADLMPTLLGLTGLPIPETVEGIDKSPVMKGEAKDNTEAVLIACYHPFGQWSTALGGKEYRGVRTKRYTYVKDLDGPWLLFDNRKDPFQLKNIVNDPSYRTIKENLDKQLAEILKRNNDEFLPGIEYVKKWNYVLDQSGTVPYKKFNYKGEPIIE